MSKQTGRFNYGLDLVSPARHVVTVIDSRVPSQAPSFDEIVNSYEHPNYSDMQRVVTNGDAADEQGARAFTIRKVLDDFIARKQVIDDHGLFRLAVPFDELRWDGRPVQRAVKGTSELGNPFSPLSDPGGGGDKRKKPLTLAGLIQKYQKERLEDENALNELRQSMQAEGWIPLLGPAVVDEYGVTIVGNRRRKAAADVAKQELVHTEVFGDGDDADRRRAAMFVRSNFGQATTAAQKTTLKKIINEFGANGLGIFNQVELADLTGVPRQTVGRWQDEDNDGDAQMGSTVQDNRSDPRREIVQQARRDGMSQQGAANLADVSRGTVIRWLKEDGDPYVAPPKPQKPSEGGPFLPEKGSKEGNSEHEHVFVSVCAVCGVKQ